ncbi:UNVERIFIED_CONTAM: DNA polymerase [Acetivibrio alkalicellulosi]
MSKSDELKKLYDNYIESFKGEEIVLGSGCIDSKLLLIGEAPGKDEVIQGRPFVGAAGKNLNEFLDVIELKRDDIYITNAIKYRLSKINNDTGRVSNRPATKSEIDANREYLLKEICILRPVYIVTLGNVPLRAVMGDYKITIGDVHGTISSVFIEENEYFVFPLYHPASIIYNRSLKDIYYKDIEELKDILSRHS